MSSVPTWLVALQALLITMAQDVGKFVHRAGDYRITYDVDENHEVTFTFWTFTFEVGPGEEFTHGPYSLSAARSSTYAIDFDGTRASAHDWYKSIERLLLKNYVIDYDHPEPYGGIQPGDLTVLTYTSGDSISSKFRREVIEFTRVAAKLTLGKYVFKDEDAPYSEKSYTIRPDKIVAIQAACGGPPTAKFAFKLVPGDAGLPYEHYALKSTQQGTLDDLRQQVRHLCRKDLGPSDEVVFATKKTIYVPLGGARTPLTKV
ncbi:hypothetical protein FOL46_007053 [Perkinsus olseni]|uniref:Uncharacterized protein n=1 Tax=Perkinsus olseni TaxID=32597 RepID=A0A7J6LHC2_PEROL|nr:hypothetical protein FOL46_007053 [Perkinsus olseni]